MATWSRDEIRTILKYNFLRGLSIDECMDELKNVLADDCPHQTTVFRWYREFRNKNFSTDDMPRSGRPSDVVTPDVIEKVKDLIAENRQITYRQIEETLAISAPSVHTILHEHLKVRKICTQWVPQSLTEEQYSGNMERIPLHKALESLAWLEGTWRTENQGNGKYPTIKDFTYYEEISFTSLQQPMFNYTAQSFSSSDLKKPMHRETGFLRVNPGTNQVTLISAHNFGLTTIEYGEITDKAINLNSTDITRMKGTKMPHVTQVRLNFINLVP